MPDLPTGTVTFLFTDIEGSTQLLQELGDDRYRGALESHRRILRDVVVRHDGNEVEELLARVDRNGVSTLSLEERQFLDRMSGG